MKKILMIFFGMIILLLTCVILYLSGALFDISNKVKIQSYVFQPNNLSDDRIGRPISIENLTDRFIRERLIKKFITEYFYVIPDVDNIAMRTRANSIMAAMSSPNVFNTWRKNQAEEINTMAEKKYMRMVRINNNEILKMGDYWEVFYDLDTWEYSNDMSLQPETTFGILRLKISFEKGIRDRRAGQAFDVQKYLDDGGDPAAIFKFRIDEVRK